MWGPLYVQEKLSEFRLEEVERLRKRRTREDDEDEGAYPDLSVGARRVRRPWLIPLHVAGHALVRLGTLLEDWSHTPLPDTSLRPEPED